MDIFILSVSCYILQRNFLEHMYHCILYSIGSGDPTLGSSRSNETNGDVIMNRWVNLLANNKIKHCRGIILDLSVWPGQTQTVPDGYTWINLG